MISIDLNCDLGEGGAHDAEIMSLISSCNIACGGHSGDEHTIAAAVKLALKNRVNIGAHPSYPDQVNFGRKTMSISASDFMKSINEQIRRVFDEAKSQNGMLHHVKPHGALYNDLMTDFEKSEMIISMVQTLNPDLILFVPPGSVIEKLAKGKLKTMVEGFADRNYEQNFKLVPRKKPNALLTEKKAVLDRVLTMIKEQKIRLGDGTFLRAKFDTICMHGDNPNCVQILHYLNHELPKSHLQIRTK